MQLRKAKYKKSVSLIFPEWKKGKFLAGERCYSLVEKPFKPVKSAEHGFTGSTYFSGTLHDEYVVKPLLDELVKNPSESQLTLFRKTYKYLNSLDFGGGLHSYGVEMLDDLMKLSKLLDTKMPEELVKKEERPSILTRALKFFKTGGETEEEKKFREAKKEIEKYEKMGVLDVYKSIFMEAFFIAHGEKLQYFHPLDLEKLKLKDPKIFQRTVEMVGKARTKTKSFVEALAPVVNELKQGVRSTPEERVEQVKKLVNDYCKALDEIYAPSPIEKKKGIFLQAALYKLNVPEVKAWRDTRVEIAKLQEKLNALYKTPDHDFNSVKNLENQIAALENEAKKHKNHILPVLWFEGLGHPDYDLIIGEKFKGLRTFSLEEAGNLMRYARMYLKKYGITGMYAPETLKKAYESDREILKWHKDYLTKASQFSLKFPADQRAVVMIAQTLNWVAMTSGTPVPRELTPSGESFNTAQGMSLYQIESKESPLFLAVYLKEKPESKATAYPGLFQFIPQLLLKKIIAEHIKSGVPLPTPKG